jgi:hypothetical protein
MEGLMSEPKLPPLRWIETTLRTTTETLTRELGSPTASPPAWSESEWRVAQAAAAIHGISPLLANKLRWSGPLFWNDFLDEQRAHTFSRQIRISEMLRRIDEAARARGLAVVGLKGAALHGGGFCRADERPMADVDLLVRPQDRTAAALMIESLGYRFSFEIWKHSVFVPNSGRAAARVGEHSDNPIKIELHKALVERLPSDCVGITDLIEPSLRVAGLNSYPRSAVLMAHVLLHAAGSMVWRSLRALHLHDLATIARRMSESDWRDFTSIQGSGVLWWAHAPLVLVESYFPGAIPPAALRLARSQCPWTLRAALSRSTLADVSVSAPYVRAFPGIEWSRTPAEALRHMYERLRPNAEMLEARDRFSDYQALGEDMPWVRQSQLQRLLCFLVSHPPRVETLATVRAALLGG